MTHYTKSGVSPARIAAFDVLMAVESGKAHSDDLLRGKAVAELAQPDRNLATALVLGVLRWQMLLDEQIRPLLKKPGAKLDAEVQIALRLGAFQLLYLDRIPAHAAIDESVQLAKCVGHRFAAGMVNAVLRALARKTNARGPEYLRELDGDFFATHPAWIVDGWKRFFGAETAFAICRHGQQPPLHALRLMNASDEEELAAAGARTEPGELLTAARILTAGDVTSTAAFQAGRVRLQDEGSQLIGEIAASLGESGRRNAEMIVDLCAAPGGKTLILAERNPQSRIVACEASASRLAGLRERLTPLGPRVECRLQDAAELNEGAVYDLALADVPCSGTGTLGRNPEIRHRLREEDLARQAERQRTILRAALRAVRPGGRVVYSTCSLEPEENEQVVRAVLAEDAAVRIVPMGECIEVLENRSVLAESAAERLRACISSEQALRLLPGVFGTDGFFVSILERNA
jgi:16S rRNA (cytosine967-C5)-methyltransferase